ncbi:hypothetical protein CANCADRAFT_55744 [Tortispora caseinolytica NRRL Y-17796]|uniref:Uncharacterized protein n=1 Tax=Tortispora caseinolytica NRRL Y-17796 TaxID=767744 RepID=A0A1E4TJT0_9ASCO|nr:hypothetical protein CANCADRAFT_55744 [Tortispora caseinolytica NRRL Y-17796]
MRIPLIFAFIGACLGNSAIQGDEQDILPVPIVPFAKGDVMYVECIKRQIDNGEHLFGPNGEILYEPFATCQETGRPLEFHYGVGGRQQCTIKLDDRAYHMLQLYVHQDAPLTCKISSSANYKDTIPIVFTLRGRVQESHVDVDSHLNVVFHSIDNVPVAVGAYARGAETSRMMINSELKMIFDVTWMPLTHITDTVSATNKMSVLIIASVAVTAVICLAVIKKCLLPSKVKLDEESKFE